jgi:hypothetical protein
MTLWSWLMFAAISRSATPACELMPRVAWWFASGASLAALFLPLKLIDGTWRRAAIAVAAAALAGAAAGWLTMMLFPQFC